LSPRVHRRTFLSLAAAVAVHPQLSLALSEQSATALVEEVVEAFRKIIRSGESEAAMIEDFERLFATYGHIDVISRYVLGPEARDVSASEFARYEKAFRGYMARKYGGRFRLFIGGRVEIGQAVRKEKFVEVVTTSVLQTMEPFEVVYTISEYQGKERFHDIKIAGVSVLTLERSEVQAMLDQNNGDIDGLIATLQKA